MILTASSVWVLLCTLLAFVDAIGPVAPRPPVVAPKPVVIPKPVVPPRVGEPPRVGPSPKTPPKVTFKLPEPEDLRAIPDDASVFSLGSFEEDEHALFDSFDGPTVPFFSKMYDFFAAEETYLEPTNIYADATGTDNPFKDGRPTGQRLEVTETAKPPAVRVATTTFDPSKPTDVCRAWISLVNYCGDGGTSCGCYSGTYYVPDQWNSLAAGCAVMTTRCAGASTEDPWCQAGKTASDYSNFCTDDDSAVKFAARAKMTSEDESAPDPTNAPEATTTNDSPLTTDVPDIVIVDGSTFGTFGSATTTPHPTWTPTFGALASSTGVAVESWASRSLDSVTANLYARVFPVIALIVFFGS